MVSRPAPPSAIPVRYYNRVYTQAEQRQQVQSVVPTKVGAGLEDFVILRRAELPQGPCRAGQNEGCTTSVSFSQQEDAVAA